MTDIETTLVHALKNDRKSRGKGPEFLSLEATKNARRIHQEHPEYCRTPLIELDAMASRLGVKKILVKDESKRFGLNAFKGLGSLYALTRVVCEQLGLDIRTIRFQTLQEPQYRERIEKMVFVTATDGNHGKGLAWAAGQLGCEAHVYMPAGSSERRAQAIRNVNPKAEVSILEAGYDDTVRYASAMARLHDWTLVQDTSWEGYEKIPSWIVQGYTTMAEEAAQQMDALGVVPTHILVQAGVGAMAGGVVGYLANRYEGGQVKFIVAEPENMACIWQSAFENDGLPHAADIQESTIMAGLNCGEPCTITWPVLRDFTDWYLKCPDSVTRYGMKLLAQPEKGDPPVISGESGAVTIGLVNVIAGMPEYAGLRSALEIDDQSVILCISTEGDTDPESYREIVSGGFVPKIRIQETNGADNGFSFPCLL